jgi:hypothetical protein
MPAEQDRGTPEHRYTNLNTTTLNITIHRDNFQLIVEKYINALINGTKEKEKVQWCFNLCGDC